MQRTLFGSSVVGEKSFQERSRSLLRQIDQGQVERRHFERSGFAKVDFGNRRRWGVGEECWQLLLGDAGQFR